MAKELADRRALRFPPAVRTATVSGTVDAVDRALDAVRDLVGVDILGPTTNDDGVRAIVRFDYARGDEIAKALRSEVIRTATSQRKSVPPRRGDRPILPRLRVRFDDPEPFE